LEESIGRQGEPAGASGAGEGGEYAPPEYYWGEELSVPLIDASAVIHLCVYDGTAAPTLLGQWMTTLKWLVLDPSNCEHSALHVDRIGHVSGWFVLSDSKWGGLGQCGEIYLRLSWSYRPGLALPPPPRLTALEQLSLNSAETTLRLGNPAGVQAVLTHLPFLLDVRRVTIRDVEFFVKDLFMGRRGQVRQELAGVPDCRSTGKSEIIFLRSSVLTTAAFTCVDLQLVSLPAVLCIGGGERGREGGVRAQTRATPRTHDRAAHMCGIWSTNFIPPHTYTHMHFPVPEPFPPLPPFRNAHESFKIASLPREERRPRDRVRP
jgi:hypothetical protein